MSEPSTNLTVHIDPATADCYLVREDGFAIGAAFDNATSKASENAYLWAAAPLLKSALLQALEQAVTGLHTDSCDEPDCWVFAARAALTAAEPPAGRGAGGDRG
jgi:hypothetical protein